jgi:hypothetical protein
MFYEVPEFNFLEAFNDLLRKREMQETAEKFESWNQNCG